MRTHELVIVGGGGMGRCAVDLVDAINAADAADQRWRVVGVVDDGAPDERLWAARGVPVLGGLGVLDSQPAVAVVIAIASPVVRAAIARRLETSGHEFPVLVHPNVHRGFGVALGPGTLVCSHVSIENHISIGRHVHLNQNSTIGHDTALGDHVTISPLVAVSGAVVVEDEVFVGTGSSLNQGLRIGRGATVGAGAAVVRDVDAGVTVVGVPARPVRRPGP